MLTPTPFPCPKDCIYLIDSFDRTNEIIIFNTEDQDKEVDYFLSRSVARLNRNVQEITRKGFDITEYDNENNGTSKVELIDKLEL